MAEEIPSGLNDELSDRTFSKSDVMIHDGMVYPMVLWQIGRWNQRATRPGRGVVIGDGEDQVHLVELGLYYRLSDLSRAGRPRRRAHPAGGENEQTNPSLPGWQSRIEPGQWEPRRTNPRGSETASRRRRTNPWPQVSPPDVRNELNGPICRPNAFGYMSLGCSFAAPVRSVHQDRHRESNPTVRMARIGTVPPGPAGEIPACGPSGRDQALRAASWRLW